MLAEIVNNIEGILAAITFLISVGVMYSKLQTKIDYMEKINTTRFNSMQKDIDSIETKNESLNQLLVEIKISLSDVKNNVEHIKEKLDKEGM